jgi:hypothetical protein
MPVAFRRGGRRVVVPVAPHMLAIHRRQVEMLARLEKGPKGQAQMGRSGGMVDGGRGQVGAGIEERYAISLNLQS